MWGRGKKGKVAVLKKSVHSRYSRGQPYWRSVGGMAMPGEEVRVGFTPACPLEGREWGI